MNRAFVCLGSNLGDRKEMLKQCVERILFGSKIAAISDVYETYVPDQNKKYSYLNCCLEIETDMNSAQFMQFLREIQGQMTSASSEEQVLHQGIDLDFIGFNNEVIRTPQLTLPHPDAHRRAFVMIPLAEICPQWVHPILQKTAGELAKDAHWQGWGTFFIHGKSLLDF